MNREIKLHRCTVCGGIAEWHYVLARKDGTGGAIPSFSPAAGSKAYSPGQGTIGNEPHIVSPDYANPVTQTELSAALALRSPAA